jgi:hypothetical protein
MLMFHLDTQLTLLRSRFVDVEETLTTVIWKLPE